MAGRLKLLQFTQVVYEHIGIRSSQSNQHSRSINWRSVFMLYPPIQMTVCSLAFLLFEADNIVDAGTAFYVVDTEICCTFYYLALMWKKLKIQKLIDNFEKFVEKSEFLRVKGFRFIMQFWINSIWISIEIEIRNPDTSTKYSELIENIEKMSELLHFALTRVTFIGLYTSALAITAINYFIFDLEEESYYLPFPLMYALIWIQSYVNLLKKIFDKFVILCCRLPFTWKAPLGYSIAILGSSAATFASVFCCSPTVCFAIASCWLIFTFIEDIESDLSGLNTSKIRKINSQTLKKRFCKIVRQFCKIEELSARKTNQRIERYRWIIIF